MGSFKPYLTGLTGGIASGKNLVCRTLSDFGVTVIDADRVYQELINPGSLLLQKITDEFGDEYLTPQGELDKKKLGDVAFKNPEMLERLNRLTHPAILQKIEAEIQAADTPLIFLAAPLLLEARIPLELNEIWVVALAEELQIERLMKRNNISREEAMIKLKSQMPLSEKLKLCDRVIDNSGTPEETKELVIAELKKLLEKLKIFDFTDDNYCFACGSRNPIGLKLSFKVAGNKLTCEFTPRREYQGFKGVVHGGIISTLLDEVMANLVLDKGFPAMTGKLEVKFHRAAKTGETIKLTAEITRETSKFMELTAFALNPEGQTLAQGQSIFLKVKAVGNFLEAKRRIKTGSN